VSSVAARPVLSADDEEAIAVLVAAAPRLTAKQIAQLRPLFSARH
jgi:hypothetical protein